MATKTNSEERFFDLDARGKFGTPWELGEAICGQATCGNEEIKWGRNEYGVYQYGKHIYGSDDKRWGVYRPRGKGKTKYTSRENFMMPKNPRSPGQTTQRNKMTPNWIAYRAKTDKQKKADAITGGKLGITGPQYHTKIYLLTH